MRADPAPYKENGGVDERSADHEMANRESCRVARLGGGNPGLRGNFAAWARPPDQANGTSTPELCYLLATIRRSEPIYKKEVYVRFSKVCLVLAALALSGIQELRAGSYISGANSQSLVTEYTGIGVSQLIMAGQGSASIYCDPTGTLVSTSGDTSYYNASYEFEINIQAPFFATSSNPYNYSGYNLAVTAPPPSQGMDSITFYGAQQNRPQDYDQGQIKILAPNGTLSTSTIFPADLTAFQDYAVDHVGDYFSYNLSGNPWIPTWMGIVEGNLAVPEPSSIALMLIGIFLPIIAAVVRRPRKPQAA
jgi:hypothetical protein